MSGIHTSATGDAEACDIAGLDGLAQLKLDL